MQFPEALAQDYATTLRLEALRGVDSTTCEALSMALPFLGDHFENKSEVAALVETISQVALEAPDAASVLVGRLSLEPDLVSNVSALRKWALHGLTVHRTRAKHLLAHFQLGSPGVFCDAQGDDESEHLLERRASLLHYLQGFGCQAKSVELVDATLQAQPQRAALLDRSTLRMPRLMQGSSRKERDALYRATAAHIAAHVTHSPLPRESGNRRPMLLALIGLLEDSRVERLMLRNYPGLHEVWGEFHTANRVTAGFQFPGLAARLSHALHDPKYVDKNDWVTKARTAFEEIAARDLNDVAAFDRLARELSIQMGRMRQAVPDHYLPQPLYRDDNSLLWITPTDAPIDEEIKPELEIVECDAKQTVQDLSDFGDMDLRPRFRYDEWDQRLGEMRVGWATVIDTNLARRSNSSRKVFQRVAHRNRVRGLEKTPDRANRLNRQPEGDEFDLDAAVEGEVLRRLNIAPDERIFRKHGRRRKTTAVVLLMDLSISTGRFVPGSFTTVMDVEKRAAAVVAQALDQRHDRVAIHGFCSNGRHEVNYVRVKNFDDAFDDSLKASLQSLKGDLSTRMGAALRHAAMLLSRQEADNKVILMLTDGEPSDIDVLEDDYLVQDARSAVTSASSKGIRTFCLTLDRRADTYVSRIFGERNYLIADRAESFAGWAGQSLVRLVAN